MPGRKYLVILNAAAGTLAKAAETSEEAQRITRAFAAHGIDVEIRMVPGPKLVETAAEAAARPEYDAIIAGGGDGTLSAVACALAGTDKPYGVLPLGTHNHFAKDLNTPLDLEPAVDALVRGEIRPLSIAEVNGKPFLNFAAIGLHPDIVRHRDAQRKARRRNKWIAMLVAAVRVITRLPVRRLGLTIGGRTFWRVTTSVIVCTNVHQMRVFGVEDVSCADRSTLNVYIARKTTRAGVVWLILRAMFRQLGTAAGFEAFCVKEVTVHATRRRATERVALDGEVMDLQMPLLFRVRPQALRVIHPAPAEQPAEAAEPAPASLPARAEIAPG